MRRSVLSGLAALAVMLGCSVPAAAGTLMTGTAVAASAAVPDYTGPLGVLMGAGNKVSCPTLTTCLAVGQGTGKTGAWKAIAEVWHAGGWKPVTVTSPGSTAKVSNLFDVSCKTASYCLAVGL